VVLAVVGGCVLVAALALLGPRILRKLTQSEYRYQLPDSAADVREHHVSDGRTPEFEHMLRARIEETDFLPYVERLGGMTPHAAGREYEDDPRWLTWDAAIGFDGDWWDPGGDLSRTWIYQHDRFWEYAKYERGHVYVKALLH